jgi:anaerobic selenocysteine-containing dehydrogenase
MLEWLAHLDPESAGAPKEFPFMLAAGQRRMFNANQIFRDPAWRRDDPDGALLINSADLGDLGASDGDWLAVESAAGRLVARCKADDSMRKGQLALPHGYGQSYPAADGERLTNGPRINLLTESGNRDPIAGTPYHKHVAVRLSRVPDPEAAACQMNSARIHSEAAAARPRSQPAKPAATSI